jgi:hypothetical protein
MTDDVKIPPLPEQAGTMSAHYFTAEQMNERYLQGWNDRAAPPAPADLTDERLLQIRDELGTGVHQRLFLNIARAILAASKETK